MTSQVTLIDRARAERLLAHCRAAEIRVVLLDGKIYSGVPDPHRIQEGCFGWREPPENYRAEIDRYVDAITAILGDGSTRPWGVEQLIGGCLLYWPDWPRTSALQRFSQRRRRRRREDGDPPEAA
jgi:hypothetical protein